MDYEAHIREFADLAQEYCLWVEGEENKSEEYLIYIQVLLSKLYCWGIQLLECDPTELLDSNEKPDHDHQLVLSHFKGFPIQYYSMIFNANIVPSEEPVTCDVIDDLADIYKDLKDGLWYLSKVSELDALFQWRFSFGVHWARHVMGAMYALS
jgi:hypothetical protein